MFKWFNKKKKDNKGFTLVELVVVVAILAILVGILAPQYTKYVERSRKSADAANLDSLVTAVKVAVADQSYSDLIPATDSNGNDNPKTITITMNANGSDAVHSGTDLAKAALAKAFAEYAGTDWKQTTLKSNAWANTNTSGNVEIMAVCTIHSNGSVDVAYTPAGVKNSVKED